VKSQTIKLWHIDINDTDANYGQYWSLLDLNERHHADSLKTKLLHNRYVEIHARLRILLADALKLNPLLLRIHKTKHGKPYLIDYPDLKFNLSHTSNKMLIALAWNCELGVDIEACKPRANLAALVEKCFADEEKHYWQNLPESEKTPAFYRFWTHKEAFVKAIGRGIALGLNRCVINPKNPNELLRIPLEYGSPSAWFLHELALGADMSASLAIKGKDVHDLEIIKLA
jgi:4'-phosphopantetheinyl transferase